MQRFNVHLLYDVNYMGIFATLIVQHAKISNHLKTKKKEIKRGLVVNA